MKELIIINQEEPIIDVNFDEVKADLEAKLEEYTKLVVTEDSLSFCKSEQKHLAALRKKIDTYRKDVKRELSKPITEFEGKCKELIALVEDAEKPIKEGIEVFDNQRREEKKMFAIMKISEIANELGLEQKYSSQLLLDDKYMNLTAKGKEVEEDIRLKANTLLIEQRREKEVLDTLNSTLERVNEDITQKLALRDFLFFIKSDKSLVEIIKEIELKAEKVKEAEEEVRKTTEERMIKEAEEKAKMEAEAEKEVIEPVPPVTPVVEVIDGEVFKLKIIKVNVNREEFKGIVDYLKANKIDYSVE